MNNNAMSIPEQLEQARHDLAIVRNAYLSSPSKSLLRQMDSILRLILDLKTDIEMHELAQEERRWGAD